MTVSHPAAVIRDARLVEEFKTRRAMASDSNHDEVWGGVWVFNPLGDDEHQEILVELGAVIHSAVPASDVEFRAFGINVSDRVDDWDQNFRCPDFVVYLRGNPARNCRSHFCGGPDFLIEIIGPGEDPYAKLDFYSQVNTREVLIVQRDPWALELLQLQDGKLVAVGKSTPENPSVLTSGVLPLTFQLTPGPRVHAR